MRIVGVIPVRFASLRFPGKPLVKIAGVEMVKRVYLCARLCEAMEDLLVATDDVRILEFCQKENIPVLRTSCAHLMKL
ncbi:hypothetical protein [Helicobacter sp. MIT 05-5294]|uniref:cytidylyltransferase domain-containing protein n=1 Tax=Helicobacter sp. MIT 05-5294 TaxID=1548150 RepID=UPI00051FE8C9|nr:hypothetical protein [Helicobacter sp. MIT 05-5294]TLD87501.1 hypothetical protein LS69_003670 [Helicobacter sp. MIT 05-5294]